MCSKKANAFAEYTGNRNAPKLFKSITTQNLPILMSGFSHKELNRHEYQGLPTPKKRLFIPATMGNISRNIPHPILAILANTAILRHIYTKSLHHRCKAETFNRI
jgi:hypothetical protein